MGYLTVQRGGRRGDGGARGGARGGAGGGGAGGARGGGAARVVVRAGRRAAALPAPGPRQLQERRHAVPDRKGTFCSPLNSQA